MSHTNEWAEAVKDACTTAHIGWDTANPRASIEALIQWHVQVALDPRVSKTAALWEAKNRALSAAVLALTHEVATLNGVLDGLEREEGMRVSGLHSAIEHMTERKAEAVMQTGYSKVGYVLQNTRGEYCLVSTGAVRWLEREQMWALMHSPVSAYLTPKPLDRAVVERLALAAGFTHRALPDGSMGLKSYVFTFADDIAQEARK